MFLAPYFSEQQGTVQIGAEQGSQFAKKVCNDFNPLHDPNNKRFCVPGDLMFALIVSKYGLSQSMLFRFVGMVSGNTRLNFPKAPGSVIKITDERGKLIVEVERHGEVIEQPELIESFVRNYVGFSGQNFPTLLVPLMAKHQVMFNPERPLVMYHSMGFELSDDGFSELSLGLGASRLHVEGKRAEHRIHFELKDQNRVIGKGLKIALIGGLKPYNQTQVESFVKAYEERRQQLTLCGSY